jgi:hypothetical protein
MATDSTSRMKIFEMKRRWEYVLLNGSERQRLRILFVICSPVERTALFRPLHMSLRSVRHPLVSLSLRVPDLLVSFLRPVLFRLSLSQVSDEGSTLMSGTSWLSCQIYPSVLC